MKALGLLRKAVSEPYPAPPHPALKFELSVVEGRAPTSDQFETMQRFYRKPYSAFLSAHSSAAGEEVDAERLHTLASKTPSALKWPLVVHWDAGKIAVGNVQDVQAILDDIKAKQDSKS